MYLHWTLHEFLWSEDTPSKEKYALQFRTLLIHFFFIYEDVTYLWFNIIYPPQTVIYIYV